MVKKACERMSLKKATKAQLTAVIAAEVSA